MKLIDTIELIIEHSGNRITASRIVHHPVANSLPALLTDRMQQFVSAYRRGCWEPLEDEYFCFPAGITKLSKALLLLKNTIPIGKTISYKELGLVCGMHPRAVGMAMARNPFPILIPCHRVVAANGAMCGFSAEGGIALKEKLLAIEKDLSA